MLPLSAIAETGESFDTILNEGLICDCDECIEPEDPEPDCNDCTCEEGEPNINTPACSDDCTCEICECADDCECPFDEGSAGSGSGDDKGELTDKDDLLDLNKPLGAFDLFDGAMGFAPMTSYIPTGPYSFTTDGYILNVDFNENPPYTGSTIILGTANSGVKGLGGWYTHNNGGGTSAPYTQTSATAYGANGVTLEDGTGALVGSKVMQLNPYGTNRIVNIDLDYPVLQNTGVYGIVFDYSMPVAAATPWRFGLSDTYHNTDGGSGRQLTGMDPGVNANLELGESYVRLRNGTNIRTGITALSWSRVYGVIDTDNNKIFWYSTASDVSVSFADIASGVITTGVVEGTLPWGEVNPTGAPLYPGNTINSLYFVPGGSTTAVIQVANIQIFEYDTHDVPDQCDCDECGCEECFPPDGECGDCEECNPTSGDCLLIGLPMRLNGDINNTSMYPANTNLIAAAAAAGTRHAASGWYVARNTAASAVRTLAAPDELVDVLGAQVLEVINGDNNSRTFHVDLSKPIAKGTGVYGMSFDFAGVPNTNGRYEFGFSDQRHTGVGTTMDAGTVGTTADNGHMRIDNSSGNRVRAATAPGTYTDIRAGLDMINWHRVHAVINTNTGVIRWYAGPITEDVSFADVADGTQTIGVINTGALSWGTDDVINSLSFTSSSGTTPTPLQLANLSVFEHNVNDCGKCIACDPSPPDQCDCDECGCEDCFPPDGECGNCSECEPPPTFPPVRTTVFDMQTYVGLSDFNRGVTGGHSPAGSLIQFSGNTTGSSIVVNSDSTPKTITLTARNGVGQSIRFRPSNLITKPDHSYIFEYGGNFPAGGTPRIRIENQGIAIGIPNSSISGGHTLIDSTAVAAGVAFTHSVTLTAAQIALLGANTMSMSATSGTNDIVLTSLKIIQICTTGCCEPDPPEPDFDDVESISVDITSRTIETGETLTLKATVLPATADQEVTWSSSNEAVATVSAAGVVTAIGAGTATITATAVGDITKTATSAITVIVPERITIAEWIISEANYNAEAIPVGSVVGVQNVPASGGVNSSTAAFIQVLGGALGTATQKHVTRDTISSDFMRVFSWTANPANYSYLKLNTFGYESLRITYDIARSSASAPFRLMLQYSTDGGSTWVNIPDSLAELSDSNSSGSQYPLTAQSVLLPEAVSNQPQVFVRWFYSDGGGLPLPAGTSNSANMASNGASGSINLRNIKVAGIFDENARCPVCDAYPCECTKLSTPTAGIGFSTEALTGLVSGVFYTVEGVQLTTTASGGIPIDEAWMGNTVSIIRVHPLDSELNSPAQSLAIPARPAAPTGVVKTDTTGGISNGKITGVNSSMEYKQVSATAWTRITGMFTTEITALPAGTYHVRTAASLSAFASLPTVNLVIALSENECTHIYPWSITPVALPARDGSVPPARPIQSWGTDVSLLSGSIVMNSDIENSNILRLTLPEVAKDLIRANGDADAIINITYRSGQNAGSSRRITVWTDLSGDTTIPTTAFLTPANSSDSKIVRVNPRLETADTFASITIPANLLKDGTTIVSEIYVFINTDNPDASAAANGRGSELNRLGLAVLSTVDACSGCDACIVCHSCACPPIVFPLPLHKAPTQDWGESARGWADEDFDSPTNASFTTAQKRTERREAGLKYLVVDFKTAPTHGWDFIIQNDQHGEAGVGWRVYKLRSTAMESRNAGTQFIIDFSEDFPRTGSPPCPNGCTIDHDHNQERFEGFDHKTLYGLFQMVFDANPAWDSGGDSFANFLTNIERAYFTNHHPGTVTAITPLPITGFSIGAGPVLSVNTVGIEDIKLSYNGTMSGVPAVRMQYSVDGGTTWINIDSAFSIITASGARTEFLPRETYNQPDLRIRWIPHGVWGRTWAQTGGSYSLSNVSMTRGLQVYESPRAVSPVLAIGSIASPPASIPQRESITVAAPTVTLRPGAPGGVSTAVTWTSSNADVAKVLGGVIRALNPGTTVIRVSSVADPTIYTEFTMTVAAPTVPADKRANFVVTSPYDDVDWSWTQYKAGLHNHDRNSDGDNTLADAAEMFYSEGFHIVSFNNHDRLMADPTATQVRSNRTTEVDAVGMLTPARRDEMAAGVGRAAGGMLFVPGTNEESLGLSAMTQAPTSHHVNTYWATRVRSGSGQQIGEFLGELNPGALARINHPGRYTGSEWPMQPWSLAEAIANDAANFMPYINLLINTETGAHRNTNLIGMELINKFDTESQAERVLWDNILSMTMPHGRNFWGFSDDDSHSNQAIGFSYNLMLMPSLSLDDFKNSMQNGTFFAFSRVDRQYGIYAGEISRWDWDGGGTGENRPARVNATRNLPTPRINSITVDGNNIIIDATLSGARIDAGSNFIAWHADGVEIHRGHTINLREHQLAIYSYVRATVVTSNGVIYTQPFAIARGDDCLANCVCSDCMAGSNINLLRELGVPEVFVYPHSCMHNGGPTWNNWCNGSGSRPNNPNAVPCWRQGDMIPRQAFWTTGNASRLQAWRDATILIIDMDQRPTEEMQLIWEDVEREYYWQNTVLVNADGVLQDGVTWDDLTGSLIIHLPTVFAGRIGAEKPSTYNNFKNSTTSLRIFIEYFATDISNSNTIVQALGVTGGRLLGTPTSGTGTTKPPVTDDAATTPTTTTPSTGGSASGAGSWSSIFNIADDLSGLPLGPVAENQTSSLINSGSILTVTNDNPTGGKSLHVAPVSQDQWDNWQGLDFKQSAFNFVPGVEYRIEISGRISAGTVMLTTRKNANEDWASIIHSMSGSVSGGVFNYTVIIRFDESHFLNISPDGAILRLGPTINLTPFFLDKLIVSVWDGTGRASNAGSGDELMTIPSNKGAVAIPYTMEDGTVSLTITDELLTALIESAEDGIVHFDVSDVSGATAVTIPAFAIEAIQSAGLTVEIDMPQGSLLFDVDALASLIKQLGGNDFKLTLYQPRLENLTEEQRAAIEPGDAVFRITIESDGKFISNFDGILTITVQWNGPFPVMKWHLCEVGIMSAKDTTYDENAKTVTFTTDHLSVFVTRHEPEDIIDEANNMPGLPPIEQAPGPQLPPSTPQLPTPPGGNSIWWISSIALGLALAGAASVIIILRRKRQNPA